MSKAMQILKEPLVALPKDGGGFIFSYEAKDIQNVISIIEEAMTSKTCEWYKEDDDDWRGSCGCLWGFNGETPTKSEAYFCPQCGGKIIEIGSKGDA